MSKTFAELRKINVNEHIEKKNNLSYLSWAWALDYLLQLDENATWRYDDPVKYGDTLMVFCTVTAFGRSRTAQLPVMDYKNKAIINPDSFAVNTAMQRCLAKAISLHGIGLYIYNGEDLPSDGVDAEPKAEEYKAPVFTIVEQEIVGKPGPWQMVVSPKPGPEGLIDWLNLIQTAAHNGLEMAESEADVMAIFTKNKALFDTVKKEDPEFFKSMMEAFTERKNKLKEKANG